MPFEKDAKTGFLTTMFMIRSPEGYKYFKIYGTDVRSLESNIKNFINYSKSVNSPSGRFTKTLEDSIIELKSEIEDEKVKFDKLQKQFDYLEPTERERGAQVLALTQNRMNSLIEQLDNALSIQKLQSE